MWPDLKETADLVTLTEETINQKLYFLCRTIGTNTFKSSRSQMFFKTVLLKISQYLQEKTRVQVPF